MDCLCKWYVPVTHKRAVVKVRGNAGDTVPGPLKIVGERFQAHAAINGTSRLRGASLTHLIWHTSDGHMETSSSETVHT